MQQTIFSWLQRRTDWRQYQPHQRKWEKQQKNKMFPRRKTKNYQYYKNRNKGKYRRVKNLYRNCILMEEPSHSFTVWSLPGNSFIAFRISLVLLVHSLQTDFIFWNFPSVLSKECLSYLHTLLFSLCFRRNNPGDYGDFGDHWYFLM